MKTRDLSDSPAKLFGSSFLNYLRKTSDVVGDFNSFPPHPTCSYTSRQERFLLNNGYYDIMFREMTRDLLKFIDSKYGKRRAIYVHGLQGVGKSHSLYNIICTLASNKQNHVIYVHDCAGWGKTSTQSGIIFLIQTIAQAFPFDSDVIDECKRALGSLEIEDTEYLLKFINGFCSTNGLKLYAVFDQHNGLTRTQRSVFPYNVLSC